MENNNEVKKIKVDELIINLNKRSSQAAKEAILKTITIKNYVSFLTKEVSARQIISTAHFSYPKGIDIKNKTEEELKMIEQIPTINHSRQYLLSAIMLIDLYTNIELDFSKAVYQYDTLAEHGVIDYIVSNIPDSEIKEFNMIINNEYDAFYQKYFSIRTYIDEKIDQIQFIISSMMASLPDEIENFITNNESE